SSGNTFTAGTLDLKVDGQDDPGAYFTVEDVKPGDSDSVTITLSNVGSVTGEAYIHIVLVTDDENGLTEPEQELDDDETDGELDENLDITITVDEQQIATGKLADIVCHNYLIDELAGETSIDVTISWSVSSDVGNIIQSDKCVFNIVFSLEQA
ncbi:hypothetical protein DRO69_13110, partial [Candidatus Bathyarchaeota archaeon]